MEQAGIFDDLVSRPLAARLRPERAGCCAA